MGGKGASAPGWGYKNRRASAWQYLFFYYKLCHFAWHSLKAEEFSLADAVITAAINEVEISIFAKMDGLKAFCIENCILHSLNIKVISSSLPASCYHNSLHEASL